jgi:RNA polymerase sigma-70 factor, ECF subfamily
VDRLTHLAHAARSGDRDATRALIDASYAEVWRLCAALVDRQTADDLAQESVLRALRALRSFRGDSSARVWMLAIARRACMDELRARHRQRHRHQRLLSTHAAEPATAPDHAAGVATQDLLSGLDPDRRAAFVLTQLLRLSYQDAASICECPPGTIRSRVARARDQLIGLLGEAPPGERQALTETQATARRARFHSA